ncbi:dynamin family protein [Actinoplanes sp. KI2]|uniref:dynamin family protein n=1 Tax=Actinoplanes sp. KI2 TaxID=2983315 RepID=UPI0021D5B479|nr:dynamin family protein [Actinoplanes sp. KI2]MCU7727337.1 dynamin family protein [Actinoplanes sp. KI2]
MTSTSTQAARPEGDVLDGLADARALAQAAGRGDLVGRLDAAAQRLRSEEATVAVVGEFKQGKSTLVNALLRTDICPVDADIVTAVPTILRFGRPPAAFLRLDGVDEPVPIPFDDLRRYITEGSTASAPAAEGDVPPVTRGVEVRLDRRLLGAGLSIIDTPGVGGLDSAQGNLTLAALSLAGAALFVTDAAQELTAPEVDFLRRALERCPRAFLVITKTDLYGEWRRIVDINEGHLRRAGLDVPIVAVSSFLRMRAQARDSTQLNEESGFPRLVDVLRRDVLGAAAATRTAAARAELAFVVAQLRERVEAEQAVAAAPAKTPEVVRRYAEKTRRGAWLAGGSWQTVLGDGVQDLSSDVEHDLRERLRLMVRRGEDLIDESDPKETWRDFQAWAQREAASAAVDNLMLLVTRTEQLAHDVAERFGLEYDSLDVDLPAPELALRKVDELDVSFQKSGVQQFLGAFTAARVTYGGIYMIGAVGAFFSLALAPIGLLAGMTLGRRMIKSERERQVLQRRMQAKAELRRYVDDVGFHVGRDCREAIRRTQRFLRDEFANRAQAVERSAAATEAAVREIAELPPDQRHAKVAQLAEARRRLDRLAA